MGQREGEGGKNGMGNTSSFFLGPRYIQSGSSPPPRPSALFSRALALPGFYQGRVGKIVGSRDSAAAPLKGLDEAAQLLSKNPPTLPLTFLKFSVIGKAPPPSHLPGDLPGRSEKV